MDMDQLATRVRDARRARKWRQRDLAEASGVALRTISGFERKETGLQPENLRSVLAALDLEAEAGDDAAEATREEWPADVRVFLDVIGMFLAAQPEEVRQALMRDVTRWIVNR